MTSWEGGDPSLLRRINSAVVLRALRSAGELGESPSVAELAAVTGLSRPTVEQVVESLLGAGYAAVAGGAARAPRVGRPARRFRFRAEAGHLLGVEIGALRVTVLVADLAGRRVGSAVRTVAADAPAEERLALVAGAARTALMASGVPPDGVRAVGVGSPGIMAADGSVRLCAALPGWTGLPLGERLGSALGAPVLVENDANAAAVGERWRGAAAGCDDVVMVLAGLSPGAGSLIGGRVHRGFGGAAGEIGALHLLGRGAAPERLLSPDGDRPLAALDEAAVGRVLERARGGEARAGAAVQRYVERLTHDVTALVLALDPELVVVGGWASGLEGVAGPLARELSRYCLRTPRVAVSELGAEAIATGALRLALDRVEAEMFAVRAPAGG
ncbi:ROK family protein [Streptomyces sp. XM4011]|nr:MULTISPECIES: ROK family protein [Streptomyces]MCK1816186.1 ROK family protein [Streptomyces sp. XM4011]